MSHLSSTNRVSTRLEFSNESPRPTRRFKPILSFLFRVTRMRAIFTDQSKRDREREKAFGKFRPGVCTCPQDSFEATGKLSFVGDLQGDLCFSHATKTAKRIRGLSVSTFVIFQKLNPQILQYLISSDEMTTFLVWIDHVAR